MSAPALGPGSLQAPSADSSRTPGGCSFPWPEPLLPPHSCGSLSNPSGATCGPGERGHGHRSGTYARRTWRLAPIHWTPQPRQDEDTGTTYPSNYHVTTHIPFTMSISRRTARLNNYTYPTSCTGHYVPPVPRYRVLAPIVSIYHRPAVLVALLPYSPNFSIWSAARPRIGHRASQSHESSTLNSNAVVSRVHFPTIGNNSPIPRIAVCGSHVVARRLPPALTA